MTKQLIALGDNRVMGHVEQRRDGQLVFTYDDVWRAANDAYPLSLSMPLVVGQHEHPAVFAFLSGLLPDNQVVLNRWGRQFGVPARNPFALLSHVGEDCAGAIQFVRPDRLDALAAQKHTDVEWLTEAQIAGRLHSLAVDHGAWRMPDDHGQFSLAGAKPKTALYYKDKKWGVPAGRTPTTHILKPPTPDFDGIAENEHLCLRLASALGLPVASSHVQHFEDQVAIVVERYDRLTSGKAITRIHQEDGCQALAVPPDQKYESDGGPGIADLVDLLRTYSSNPLVDIATFVDALIVNWLIAGTDAHAKNYSLLLGANGAVRLAPLYDLTSAVPYPSLDARRIKLAMRIGGEYVIRRVGAIHWADLARELHLGVDQLRERVISMTERMPDTIADVRHEAERERLDHPMVAKLTTELVARARNCLQQMLTAPK